MKRISRFFWYFLVIVGFILGLALLALFLSPYGAVKPLVDQFSKDGNLASFTPENFARLAPFLIGFLAGCF
jgi:hypothetical protein